MYGGGVTMDYSTTEAYSFISLWLSTTALPSYATPSTVLSIVISPLQYSNTLHMSRLREKIKPSHTF
jgi:hypothetical protein